MTPFSPGFPPLPPAAVETPAAIVDLDRIRRNIGQTLEGLGRQGLRWRPHVKTHKSRALAREQLRAGAVGLTVATPREAEVMADLTDDLLLAHPPVGPKVERVVRVAQLTRLRVALDHQGPLEALSVASGRAGTHLGILVELDVGMGRVGVGDSRDVLRLAAAAHELPGLSFDGVLFYPGHLTPAKVGLDAGIGEVNRRLEEILSALAREGMPAGIVSGGSTPTLPWSHHFHGVTEIRAGTCIFHDRTTVALGVARGEDVALRVLSTVVSTDGRTRAVLDAGSKALAREAFRGGDQGGFGEVQVPGRPLVTAVSEEHGVVALEDSSWRPRVGDTVEIVPNHVCVSVNLQDRLLARRSDGCYDVVSLEARGRQPYRADLQLPGTADPAVPNS
ncbi:MAG: D-TA family PLP-dependent enzyme [Gemmatimonadales bacterium]|nr:MAG: D-TA family PLP-dependent enzyme [Gemmatimonadales bacterium]